MPETDYDPHHEGVLYGIPHPGLSQLGCTYCIDILRQGLRVPAPVSSDITEALADLITAWLQSGYDNTDDTHHQATQLAARLAGRVDAEAADVREWLAYGFQEGMRWPPPPLVRAVLASEYAKRIIQVKEGRAMEAARDEWRRALTRSVTGPDMRLAEEKTLRDLKGLIDENPGARHTKHHEAGTCDLCDYVDVLDWYIDERLDALTTVGEDEQRARKDNAVPQHAYGSRIYTDEEIAELERAAMANVLRDFADNHVHNQTPARLIEDMHAEAERIGRGDL